MAITTRALTIGSLGILLALASPGEFKFRHHFADRALPGSGWGQTALVDLDGDGNLDFITGKSGGDIRWYELIRAGEWKMHLLGRKYASGS